MSTFSGAKIIRHIKEKTKPKAPLLMVSLAMGLGLLLSLLYIPFVFTTLYKYTIHKYDAAA